MHSLSPIETAKCAAARRASELVEDGMRVGLGTGSTSAWLIRFLGERVREEGLRFVGVPTSLRTEALAQEAGLEICPLDKVRWLDLTIDGTDEFDSDLHLIKGGGGALLQEKIVATASERMVILADAAKEVKHLGAFPLPVEIVRYGWSTTQALVEELLVSMDVLGQTSSLRMNGDQPHLTDEGNYIIDLHLERIDHPRVLAMALNQMPGVVENGLFVDICDMAVVGFSDGRVEVRDLDEDQWEVDRVEIEGPVNIFADL